MKKYLGVFIIILAVAVVYYFVGAKRNPVETEIAINEVYEDFVATTGYLIKNEKVFSAPVSGEMETFYKDGERVATQTEIATIYTGSIDTATKSQLKEINSRISDLETADYKAELFSSDISTIEKNIAVEVNNINELVHKNSLQDVYKLKEKISNMVHRKNLVSGEESNQIDTLESLRAEKALLEEKVASMKKSIVCDMSGVFSTQIDGYENILSPNNMKNMIPSELVKVSASPAPIENPVITNAPVCKIIDNSKWYVAMILSEKQVKTVELRQKVALRFMTINDESVPAYVEYISDVEDGNVVVIVSTNRFIDDIYSKRQIGVEFIKNSYSGLKVPADAIRVKGDIKGVYVNRSGMAVFKGTDIEFQNDEVAIVCEDKLKANSLILYDNVIVNHKDLYDGKLLY